MLCSEWALSSIRFEDLTCYYLKLVITLRIYIRMSRNIIIRCLLVFLQVRLGPNGVEEIMGLGQITEYESKALEAMKSELASSIQKGVDFVHQS